MKNLKRVLTLLLLITLYIDALAQNEVSNTLENGRIGLSAYVPQQVDKISPGTANMLTTKLNQIATQNGFAGDPYFQLFILTANIVPITKDYLSTAPPMTAVTLEITLYIGESENGTLFASKSITVKGVGTNETKAYIEAMKGIRSSDPAIKAFVEEGKSKIVNYYKMKCDAILAQAQAMVSVNQYEDAIETLCSVPDACMDCYTKCMDAIAPIYQAYIDRDCQMKLAEATHIWNANQTVAAANAAGQLLSQIEPRSACFKDVKTLADRISKRVFELDKREWAYKLRQLEQVSELIRAYRDIAIAWAKNRPRPVIKVERTNTFIKNWININ